MDKIQLRNVLRPLIVGLSDSHTHAELPSICASIGLPVPDDNGSKRERLEKCYSQIDDQELTRIAQCLLNFRPPAAEQRNAIQDLLWSDSVTPSIPKRARRLVAQSVDDVELFLDAKRFDEMLDRLWVLDNAPLSDWFDDHPSLRAQIDQHIHRNDDWDVDRLFNELGCYEASDRRFISFLEGLVSPEVRPDEASQRRFATTVNTALRTCGAEFRHLESRDGYPVFRIVPIYDAAAGRPKNLIFASSIKPDLRFRDAVNNDIEIVSNSDKVLVYDRPIGADGVRWCDLQDWWMEKQQSPDRERGKRTLYQRLRGCLPPNSPPQVNLYDSFHRGFAQEIPRLPALLPEVWLHWDPQTVRERGRDALLRFRMDFLLLLPQGVRVVVEVDGMHHYARDDGSASCERYAKLAAADRELKLAGYHVFRFGATELLGDATDAVVHEFFAALFKRFGISS